MKSALIFLFVGFLMLIVITYLLEVDLKVNGVDIHIHDSYYVVSYSYIVVFSILFIATCFSLGGILYSGVRKRKSLV